jgi:hypothetical protein|tara:strand:- start:792 stop:1202 length:411 start_codon:yes stop_codon:yes gene_type:complete
MKAKIEDCKIINLPVIEYDEGNISPINGESDIPFAIRRVFYLYDIPGGQDRGAHAHRSCHQFLIAGSGAFDVMVDDGASQKIHSLNRPYYGLHVPPGIWASEKNFSSGSICLVLTSHGYDAADYIRNYNEFIEFNA